MSGYHALHMQIIDAFAQLATFTPESATDMQNFLAGHHEMWEQVGGSYTAFADRAQSEMPYGPATADGIRDIGAAALSVGQLAQNVHSTFRSEHEVELNRIEAPRADEGQWDIGRQG